MVIKTTKFYIVTVQYFVIVFYKLAVYGDLTKRFTKAEKSHCVDDNLVIE